MILCDIVILCQDVAKILEVYEIDGYNDWTIGQKPVTTTKQRPLWFGANLLLSFQSIYCLKGIC